MRCSEGLLENQDVTYVLTDKQVQKHQIKLWTKISLVQTIVTLFSFCDVNKITEQLESIRYKERI